MTVSRRQLTFTLVVLFLVNFMNFYDRQVLGAIGEVIKREWQLTDSQLAGLTTAFVLLYAVIGIPLGRLADVGRRRLILAVGVFTWSVFTGLSGLAPTFAWLVVCRLGVGVGEASAAPASNSLIGDLFPPEQRARAISVFMLGLPLGNAASFLVSGLVAKAVGGWRPALLVAAVPGILLAILTLWLPDPERGAADRTAAAQPIPAWASIRGILSIRTMWWIIASGALFNLNMYALAAFQTSFFIRFHGLDIDMANRFGAAINLFGGGFGLIVGGFVGDRVARWAARQGASAAQYRLRAAATALALTAPLMFMALQQAPGQYWAAAMLILAAACVMFVYYSTVYATIQDIVGPRERGTAMSVYFFVFYVFTAIGLVAFGRLSDTLAAQAVSRGATAVAARAAGLHGALYAVPTICVALVFILWAASGTAVRDEARRLAGPVRA
ncbi:MAG: MFS transporter [Gemmatimonadaceae bacterium]